MFKFQTHEYVSDATESVWFGFSSTLPPNFIILYCLVCPTLKDNCISLFRFSSYNFPGVETRPTPWLRRNPNVPLTNYPLVGTVSTQNDPLAPSYRRKRKDQSHPEVDVRSSYLCLSWFLCLRFVDTVKCFPQFRYETDEPKCRQSVFKGSESTSL